MRFSRKTRDVLASHMAPEDAAVFLDAHPVPPPTAVAGGRRAHAHGESLEAWLTTQHEAARARGLLARMRHVGAPTEPYTDHGRAVRDRRGRLLVVIAGVGPADYQGQLPGGRAVALEAKSREGRLYRADIAPHQQVDLDDCAAGGGLAVLVARLCDVLHAIPWRVVPWVSPRAGRPSIGEGDAGLSRWRVDPRCLLHPLDARWTFYLTALTSGE